MLGQRQIARRANFETEALVHLNSLYATGLRMTRNPRDAEDLVQDTVLQAFRFFDRFEAGTNCKAWMFKILTNTFINKYRKRSREREIREVIDQDELPSLMSEDVAEASRDPEGAMTRSLLSDDVKAALDAVPHDYRIAVVLCDLEEFSYKEIADIMDCPVGTVMSRLHRGRRLLQKALRGYAVEQGILKEDGAQKVLGDGKHADVIPFPPSARATERKP
jgi:RNA polymerase sigma-70 factor (ECF subfamily)